MIFVTGMATPISTRTDKRALSHIRREHIGALVRRNFGRKNQTVLNQSDLPRRKIIYRTNHTELFLGYHFRQNRSCLL